MPLAARSHVEALPNLAHVRGHEAPRQALEVAAAGAHSLQERIGLGARAVLSSLRAARTIADLTGAPSIGAGHVAEAVQYRDFTLLHSPAPALTLSRMISAHRS